MARIHYDLKFGFKYLTFLNSTSYSVLGSIFIVYEWSKDGDNKDKDLKAKIYHPALKTIL